MPWFMTDDKLHSHKKIVRATQAGVAPMGLWVIAGSWSADQLTDGFIPEYIAIRIDPLGWKENTTALVRAGLWVEDEHEEEAGWRFHDWEDRQPTREAVMEKREQARDRMARVRANRKKSSPEVRANTSRTSAEPDENFARSSDSVRSTPALPSPTQPEGSKEPSSRTAAPRSTKGTRIHEPFPVTPEMVEWFRAECPLVDGKYETEQFVDYWAAKTGANATKLDWERTWKTWMRKAQKSAKDRPSSAKSSAPERLTESEKCPEHRRALPCALCKAEQMGTQHAA
jgi:hypothetical protein